MGAARVDVQPGAIQRVILENTLGATGDEHLVDRLSTLARYQGRVEAHFHTVINGQFRTGSGGLHHGVEVTEHDGLAFVYGGDGLGQRHLRVRVGGDLVAVIETDAVLVNCDIAVYHTLEAADTGGGDGAHEDLAEGQAEDVVVVYRIARAVALKTVDGAVCAVLWHKSILDDDVMAAGALQTADIPVVDDFVVAKRHHEGAVVRRRASLLRGYHSAEEGPFAVFGPGGEAPVTGQPVATLYMFHLAYRHIGGGDQRGIVFAPDILLRLVIEQAQLPVVNGDYAQYPGGGHTAFSQDHLHFEEDFRIHLEAAVAGRLHNAEEAGFLHGSDRRFGQLPQPGGFLRAVAQRWYHVACGFVE